MLTPTDRWFGPEVRHQEIGAHDKLRNLERAPVHDHRVAVLASLRGPARGDVS
jgi:hypothetical protein